MPRTQSASMAALALCTASIAGCGGGAGPPSERSGAGQGEDRNSLNLYTWADYLAPDTIGAFERETGLKVRVSFFETNETLESRMLTGRSGFDVVVPTAPYLERQIKSGAYLTLDRTLLPNLANLDPAIMARVAQNDPGNAHAVVYAWGTYGIAYNRKMVADALPNVAIDSWRVLFDPAYAAKLAKCGINFLDAPAGVERLVLKYLGKEPNAPSPQDLAEAERQLLKIRPYIRTIDSSIGVEALANGDICVGLEYNGTAYQARRRAQEAKNGIAIDYSIPKEGSLLWFDMLAIPKDAPHPTNAHRFINYLMTPRVIAHITEYIGNANANAAATPLIEGAVAHDAVVYPTPEEMQRLFVQRQDAPEQARALTRIWQKFKTAQ